MERVMYLFGIADTMEESRNLLPYLYFSSDFVIFFFSGIISFNKK